MRKWFRITLFVLIVAGVGGVTWLVMRQREPVYEGKPLSYWLGAYHPNVTNNPPNYWLEAYYPSADQLKRRKADEAITRMGTNAIPTLLRILRAGDSDFKIKLSEWAQKQHFIKIKRILASDLNNDGAAGFGILGPAASNAVPALIEIYEQNISEASQSSTLAALGGIGPAAEKATPLLVQATNHPSMTVRANAAWALGQIHPEAGVAVPVLIQFLHDSDPGVRVHAASAFWSFGADAKQAVPALVELLNDQDKGVRHMAIGVLRHLDPEAAAKAGVE